MNRKSIVIFMLFGAVFLPATNNAFSAGAKAQANAAGVPEVGGTYIHGRDRNTGDFREKNTAITSESGRLRDAAMRFSSSEQAPPSSNMKQVRSADEGRNTDSWLAMLAAGFGVSLISIIRRMGNLR